MPLYSESQKVAIHSLDPPVISVDLELDDRDFFLTELERGGESQIILEISLYEEKQPFLFLERDKRLFHRTFDVMGSKEKFSDNFKIIGAEGDISYWQDREDFLEHFLSNEIEIYDVNWDYPELSSYYMRIRAILIKRTYVRPFHLMQFMRKGNRITMEWECTLDDLKTYP